MPRTPDRRPGQQLEDDHIAFEDRGTSPGVVGSIYRKTNSLFAEDAIGEFNLRQGAATSTDILHHLIITTWGGVVYDTLGEVVHKASP